MRKICPQCQGTFPGQLLCPRCGIQLMGVDQHSTKMLAGYGEEGAPKSTGMATRFFAGAILAQGLYYGMTLLGSGFFNLIGMNDGWTSSVGRIAHPALLLTAALAGGILAGAGNPRGLAAGAAIGLLHALALIGSGFAFGRQPETLLLYAGCLVLPLVGGVGGRYGRFVWPPLSDVFDVAITPAKGPANSRQREPRKLMPTAWFRVLGGAALAIGCTVWAGHIRMFIVGTSGGAFVVDSHVQIQFVTWVISALAIMIGAAFAGASTGAGLRHGLLVGLLACTGIFVLYLHVIKEALPAEQFFASLVGLSEETATSPARIGLFLATNSLGLSIFGGWFGATLLPRTVAGPSRLDRGAI